jgi:UDP-3-O-[3-hydroxymyristoyl] glucosamine N-acyltransferase
VITLGELAELTDATVIGDDSVVIRRIKPPQEARKGDICFISNNKYLPLLETCEASTVILKPEHESFFNGNKLIHANPYFVYAKVSTFFPFITRPTSSIHSTAVIDDSVIIGEDVYIGPHVVIEKNTSVAKGTIISAGCYIGEHVTLGGFNELLPNVTVFSHTKTGKNCRLHSGSVVGDEGFGFASHNGKWHRIEQIGNVELGDDVEIGSNTTIDRAALNTTFIGNGVKIDNQVQVAHNVQIGEHSIIIGGVGIAGSTKIGKSCILAGASGVAGHLDVADGVTVTAMSRVLRSLKKPGASYSSGTALEESLKWRRNAVRFTELDDMAKRLKKLEKKLNKL